MADTEIVPFENQTIDTPYPDSPIPVHEENNFAYDGGRKLAAQNVLAPESSKPQQRSEAWEENNPTPPITVPYSEEHPDHEEFADDSCYAHPSPLGEFSRKRRPSISFNPEVTLDCGTHLALDEPLRNLRLEEQAIVESPCSGDSGESGEDQTESHHDYHGARPLFPRGFSQQEYLSPGSDNFSVDTELPRASSLTSLSTASPITDELRTPPDGRRDVFLPTLPSSPLYQPHSLDGAEGWFGRHGLDGKPRSYSGRNGSLRLRHGSRRSTNSGGKSPASAFLSMFGREASAPKPDDEGQLVGTDYVLGKTIGYGGFSTVKEAFKVKDDGKTERFAVKIVKKNLAGQSERQNEQFQAEFDHEVRVWRYLNHFNVLPLDAVYETDYATFCFTRMTNGGTLFDLVKRHHREGLRMDQAKHYAYQLASAIRYLHEDARVVHRDVKLENCLLQFEDPNDKEALGKLYLCDFGMSEWMMTDNGANAPAPYDDAADRPPPKKFGPSNMSTSIAGGVAGSLEYAAPELIHSKEGVLEPAVDMWAFGVIVFALVVGSRPFDHIFQPKAQANIVNGRWDRRAVFKGETDLGQRRDALALIQGCLELDPIKRWTIADVLECRWFDDCVGKIEEHIHPQWKY
ncbi:predicted protein [Uncinocarpus reesii 1704]|uniref:Protein kinase domain-containing protein n=1 Tax=Uncinocarpus reesii (strain UAMH 1704) TaxID=336963 RepID=C4JQJ1_UNCRE|nr:uncharacterized protein UREG_03336 [Uncinocarpus reesii 1704]EEP78490.1 predicted protein [Uncinocarpus reesii 1704]